MPATNKARESLRKEAARRGVTVSRVRSDRAAERGVSRSAALGHPRRGETPLSIQGRRSVELGGPESPLPVLHIRQGGADGDRAYRLVKDFHDLLGGNLPPADWDRRWAGHQFGGQRLPSAGDILASAQRGDIDATRVGTP